MNKNNVYLSLALAILFAFPITASSTVHQVDMIGLNFVPDSLNILHGDTVLWVNQTTINHTTTSGTAGVPDGFWDSGLMPANDSFAFTFDTTGTFDYFCTPHWQLGMAGVVVVTQTSIEEKESFEARSITSFYNHPNPFKNSTRIHFSIADSDIESGISDIRLSIFNTAGRLVMSFEESAAQTSTIIWDGRDHGGRILPEGVYIGKLIHGRTIASYKMLKLR